LDPDNYHKLMFPLRAERVFPKIAEIMRDFPGKVLVSVPVSRLNQPELPAIADYFRDRGALEVVFDPLSNRCGEDMAAFNSLALAPVPIRCPSEVLNDLIVDCDGKVLVCCQDFRRMEPIGDLSDESLAGVLTNMRRRTVRERFDEGRHTEMTTCRNCYADLRRA
jgi:radical SAM protein with 4Fe4S-binding SPASM domain